MEKLKGLNPPVITIFDANGEIDLAAMRQHADYMIANGVDGLAYLGTSGEFGVMTQAQKLTLIHEMTPYCKGRAQVIIGVGDTCLTNTLELAQAAEEAGADALLSVIPYFSVYAEKNVEAYYDALAQATRLPLILYNFPALTGFDLSPQLVERLALRHENVLGVKDTVPETEHLRAMLEIKKKKPEFSVFCAYETQALEMIRAGVDGFVNATANFAPQYTAALLQAHTVGDEAGMERSYRKMCQAGQVYNYATPLLLAVKEAVYQKVLGRRGYEKLPGLPLKPEAAAAVAAILKELDAE